MKSNNLIILCLCLTGCQDLSFDYFGRPPATATQVPVNEAITTKGDVVTCTSDDQCGGLACVKEGENYLGVCAQVEMKK